MAGSGSEASVIALGEIPNGTRVRLSRIAGEGSELAVRLASHGFWPGTEITVIRRAPFGDPIQVRLRGLDLALRRDEAQQIWVSEVPQ
jgi:Fe2+ transport system protein FeoA